MNGNLKIVVLAQTLIALSIGIFGPIYYLYIEKVLGSLEDLGLLIGIYWVIVGLMEIPSGFLADKFGRKRTYFVGSIISSISFLFYPFVSDFNSIILLQIIEAIGYSLQTPSFFAILAEITKKEKRGIEMGIVNSSYNIFYGFASIFSSFLINIFGISSLFIIASMLNLMSTFILVKNLKL